MKEKNIFFSPVRCRCLFEKGNEGNYFNENGFSVIKCFWKERLFFGWITCVVHDGVFNLKSGGALKVL